MGIFLISVLLYKHHQTFFSNGLMPLKRGSSKNLFIRYSYRLSLILTKRIGVTRHARNSIYSQQTTHRQCVGWALQGYLLVQFWLWKMGQSKSNQEAANRFVRPLWRHLKRFSDFFKRMMSKKVRRHRAFSWLALLYNHHHHLCR